MQTHTLNPKSKNQRKLSPKSKKSHSINSKSQEIQSDPEQSQYLGNSNLLNGKISQTNVNKQIIKLLKQCKKHPTQSLASLCTLYESCRSYFYQCDGRKLRERPIFDMLLSEIQYFNAFPLMQRERIATINQNVLQWIKDKKDPCTAEQLLKLHQLESKVFQLIMDGQKDRIIQNMLYLLLKIPIVLANSCQNQEEINFCQEIINHILINFVHVFDKNIQLSQQTQGNIIQFHTQSLKLLTIISNNTTIANYHLFSFATLTFTSKHASLCKKIIFDAFALLQEKQGIKEGSSLDQQSFQNAQFKNKTVLLVSSLLKFDSVIDPQSIKKKSTYIKQVTLLTLLAFKPLIVRLIDELQHLEKPTIPSSTIRGMFEIAKFCNDINKLNLLPQIIKKIQSVKQLAAGLNSQEKLFLSCSPKDMQPFDALVKNVQKILFEIMCKVQKSICNYNLQIFMDLYIEHPLTFRSEYFIEQTFKNQHDTIILSFMKAFTSKWALTDLKTFDFSFYLLHFIKKCINKDTMDILGAFIKQISVQQLIKVNVVIYKLSFEDDNKKYMVPQNSCRNIQFASLSSGGYCDKFMLINQTMPQFSEQLMWRQLIHHLVHSLHFIVVKSFFNVVNYQFTLNDTNDLLAKLIRSFEGFIDNEEIQQIYATFHLIACILFRKHVNIEHRMQKYEGKLLQVILAKGRKLLTIHETVCARRRSAMNSINMSKQMMSQTMRCFDRLKKMNGLFLKSIHIWVQNLMNMKDLLSHNHSYQDIIQVLLQLSKDNEYKQFHQVRYLSHYCSQKYFNNIIEYKVKSKIGKKEMIAFHYMMVLRQIINNFIEKYPSQPLDTNQCIEITEILNYYSFVLHLHIEVANQRQILKSKLIILYQIVELTAFFKANSFHPIYQFYSSLYNSSLRHTLLQIIVQNPQYVSKYQREFIIHMRIVAIAQMIKHMGAKFQIISEKQVYSIIYQLCYDKHVQIRFIIINMLTSRFKHQLFYRFLSNKYQTATLLTTIAIFETNPAIKAIATKIAETFKTVGKDCCSLGLIILLHSIKHILNLTYRNLYKQEYCTYIDAFLTNFHKFWLNQKEWQYSTYNFACKFIEQHKIHFILQQPSFQSQVQTYYVEKEGSDYCLERQIKQYLKKQQDFSFQFPPQENIPNQKQTLINNLMYSLPFRIFHKVKQVINKKSRTRILRYKKDIDINWQLLENSGLIQCHKKPQGEFINLHI